MIKLIDILNENNSIPGLEAIRDWVVDDYNADFGYNSKADTETLIKTLEPYKKFGRILRVVSVPKDLKDLDDVEEYINNRTTPRLASFTNSKAGIKYFLPYVTQLADERPVILTQVCEYWSLVDWYRDNYDKLESLYETDPDKYWWIDTNLPEVGNTGEVIAKLKPRATVISPESLKVSKDILNESNNTPDIVYHFTLPKYFVNMVKTNTIKADPKFKQISFTTDPDLWAFKEFPNEDQEVGVRLTFNTKDLPPLTSFKYSGAPGEDYGYEQEYTTNVGDLRPANILNLIKDITATEYWREYLQKNLPEDIFRLINFV